MVLGDTGHKEKKKALCKNQLSNQQMSVVEDRTWRHAPWSAPRVARILVEFEERARADAPLQWSRHRKEGHPMARVKALTVFALWQSAAPKPQHEYPVWAT